ncbi:geranylgeranyl reductase family protein [Propioniciclava soli]|uniref:Geranylgeranyl reductase family protein n=1 Tax=Propioniciclava soli TaxID=2775081 RepID=A0ABZ3C9G8_9ACTN
MTQEDSAAPVRSGDAVEADVIVVGAGPAGSTAATWLARRGLDVALLEKARFPRDKVCGDGLTPRATKQLVRLGVDVSEAAGWKHNVGLRTYGARREPFHFPWPELESFPNYGLTRPRADFDHLLARLATDAGAHLYEDTTVSEPILAGERIVGVRAKDGRTFRARVTLACDGNSSRLALGMGLEKNRKRPMGVAVRTYYRSEARTHDAWMESHLQLWDGEPGRSHLLPGYGWVFALGDGTVNVGMGTVSSTASSQKVNFRDLLNTWVRNTPPEWGFTPENQIGGVGSAALPMSFNRKPAYGRGLLLVGDSGGMVSPFNGEGIPYAMEAAEMAADAVADARSRGFGTPAAERALEGYASRLSAEWGGYYRLGQVFVSLIERPEVMALCTRYGLPRPTLMKFTMKMLAHLYDTDDGDWMDKMLTSLSRMAPSA